MRVLRTGSTKASATKPRSGLEEALMSVAPDKEVMIAISNYNLILGGQLTTWLETVKQAQVTNYLVVAIDQKLRDYLVEHNFNVWFMEMKVNSIFPPHRHTLNTNLS